MKILVYGAGALGSVFGGFLSDGGHDVTLLGRKWHIERIEEDGLFISGIWGTKIIDNLKLASDFSEIKGDFDLILVTVKSYDTEEAGKDIKKILGEETLVIHLQNGLGNAEILLKYIPEDRLITGRVIFGVEIEPGMVEITVSADETVIGTLGSVPGPTLMRVADIFSRAEIPCRTANDISKYLWAKTLYNCALNPLATLLEVPYGFLADNEYTIRIMDGVIDEIYDVGSLLGVKFDPETPEGYKKIFYSQLIPVTAEHHASMLQDIRKGKRTEIDALCGAIVRYGEELNVETPYNSFLADLIKAKEIRANKGNVG